MTSIAVLNVSTVLTDAEVSAALPALQKQISRDFAPFWGVDANLHFFSKGEAVPGGAWQVVIGDSSDQVGALGYHDLTPDGLPLGKVFAKTDLDLGQKWTVTASHELLEMLGDPDINLTVLQGNLLYAYEVCDACEADQYGYEIDGVTVSDFVFPSWFETFRTSGPFDFQKKITAPLQLLSGGYIGVMDLAKLHQGWTQLTAEITLADTTFLKAGKMGAEGSFPSGSAPLPFVAFREAPRYSARPRLGSRRERRRTPRNEWTRSKA